MIPTMSPPPRRLSFAVGTTLLTASLAAGAAGCAKEGPTVNVAPPEDVHVNEGPEPEPEGEEVEAPDDATVNTVPESESEPE
jgi:hypothetical protein